MHIFTYGGLNHEKREIRLIKILPSKFNLGIRCRLLTFPVKEAPPYEALSYTWGDHKTKYKIMLNGKRSFIAKNLYDALRRFRLKNEARLLWADAICINQADKQELAKQVQMMPDIYRTASNVLVWLGGADKKSTLALRYLHVLGSNFGRGLSDEEDRKMFQERPKPFKPHVPRLEDVFAQMRERGTSDPRDRIYATISLLPFDDPRTLEIDYTLSAHKLYERATLLSFNHGSLRFLQYCQPHIKSPDLPSWIPDWSGPRLTPPLQEGMFTNYYRRYKAAAMTSPKYHGMATEKDDSPVLLVATGILVDRVATVTCNYDLEHSSSPHWEEAALKCAVGPFAPDKEDSTPLSDVDADTDSNTDSDAEQLPPVNEPDNHSLKHEYAMEQSKYKSGCSMWEAYLKILIADRTSSEEKSDIILAVLKMIRAVKRYEYTHFS
ncbi:hypothetical protein K402DRAFT_389648 [Aulographum hederae CBS 113979]|uniref:Heterokaryon incompatibility domain-containing protein n=1 Tax=Aulographum hederae CBS 113979 TaxID=1176131 RepID=A0A6G1HCF6_9PEZI|nr:hypothetical protein K402DRAFT_389648 [Aulographum hederae CBS 113979]